MTSGRICFRLLRGGRIAVKRFQPGIFRTSQLPEPLELHAPDSGGVVWLTHTLARMRAVYRMGRYAPAPAELAAFGQDLLRWCIDESPLSSAWGPGDRGRGQRSARGHGSGIAWETPGNARSGPVTGQNTDELAGSRETCPSRAGNAAGTLRWWRGPCRPLRLRRRGAPRAGVRSSRRREDHRGLAATQAGEPRVVTAGRRPGGERAGARR